MQKKLTVGLPHLVLLQFFTLFPEYFISVSTLYILIVVVLITYNVYGLMLQKAISECIALILLMACYLIINDDLLILNFATFNHLIINDYLAFLTKTFVCFFSALYFWLIADSLKDQKLISLKYLLVVLFSVLGLMLIVGYYTKDMIVGLGNTFFGTVIHLNLQNLHLFQFSDYTILNRIFY